MSRRREGTTAAGYALRRLDRAQARQRQAELDRWHGKTTIHAVESAKTEVSDAFREWDKACDQEQGKTATPEART